jgi:hypothetical protein
MNGAGDGAGNDDFARHKKFLNIKKDRTVVYSASTPAAFKIFAITGDSARIFSSTLPGVLCCGVIPSLA